MFKPHRRPSRPVVPSWGLPLPLLLLPLAACAAATPGTASTDGTSRIEALIGDARCSSEADCRSSSIGQQPCGGPAGFVAWSVQQTSAAALQAELQHHQARQLAQMRGEGEGAGRMSTCMVNVDPGATCQAVKPAGPAAAPGRCTLRPKGSHPTR